MVLSLPPSEAPLSPELVLVSPELRERALAALPERPWENLWQQPPQLRPAAFDAPNAAAVAHPAAAVEAPLASQPVKARSRGRGFWLIVAGLVAGFLVAEAVPRPDGPTLVQTVAEPAARVARERPAPGPEATPAAAGTASTKVRVRPTVTAGVAVAGGGYVFGRWGRFQVAPNRRSITRFQAHIRCARSVSVAGLPLRGGRFRYRGLFGRHVQGSLHLFISGRFVARTLVRGVVRARTLRCDSGAVPFVATLS